MKQRSSKILLYLVRGEPKFNHSIKPSLKKKGRNQFFGYSQGYSIHDQNQINWLNFKGNGSILER